MLLKSLILRNFRNYEEAHLDFSPTCNIFYGDNAQGKTNLLEALYLLITGRSFRTTSLSDLIRIGSPAFFVSVTYTKHEIDQKLEIAFDGTTKRITHNDTSYSSFAELFGQIQGVLLAPQDLNLLTGSPSTRRRLIDLHLAQLDPLYIYHLGRYHRALRQRNTLLRKKTTTAIEVWEAEMTTSASYLSDLRQKLIDDLGPRMTSVQATISAGNDPVSLTYRPSKPDYTSHRDRELILGYTLNGCHRDDMAIQLGGKEAKLFGSEGQLRSCALSLRLAEWERLCSLSDSTPLKLVDDIGTNLDKGRQQKVFDHLQGPGQTFITSPHQLDWEGKLFTVEQGQVAS